MRKTLLSTRLWLSVILCFSLCIPFSSLQIPSFHVKSASAANGTTSLNYRFSTGVQQVYGLTYQSSGTANVRQLFDTAKGKTGKQKSILPEHEGSLKVTCQLNITVLALSDGKIVLQYRLEKSRVNLKVNGQEAEPDARIIETDLDRGFYVLVNPEGRPLSLLFNPNTSRMGIGLTRAIVSLLQFVVSKNVNHGGQWETQEEGLRGPYVAHYKLIDAKEQRFQKTLIRYLLEAPLRTHGELTITQNIEPSGSLIAIFDNKAGRLTSVKGDMSEATIISGKTVASTHTKIDLMHKQDSALDQEMLARLRTPYDELQAIGTWVSISERPAPEDAERNIQRGELKKANVTTLLADLAKAEGNPASADEVSLFLKFKALLYLQPEVSSKIRERLNTASPNSITIRVLSGTLGEVGHREAQAALASVVRTRREEGHQTLFPLISALATVPHPGRESVEVVEDLADHPRDTNDLFIAELALGSMAKNLGQHEPGEADSIVKKLLDKLRSSQDVSHTENLLMALGNSGSTAAFEVFSQYSTNKSAELRRAAITGLRWIKLDEADHIIAQALTRDSSKQVRHAAAMALEHRMIKEETFKAQRSALTSERTIDVRLVVLTNLWNARQMFPEVKELVVQVTKKDPDEDLRKAARDIIATNPDEFSAKSPRKRP